MAIGGAPVKVKILIEGDLDVLNFFRNENQYNEEKYTGTEKHCGGGLFVFISLKILWLLKIFGKPNGGITLLVRKYSLTTEDFVEARYPLVFPKKLWPSP